MESYEGTTVSFVIRIWRETQDEQDDGGIWRGHITHVASGARRYFDNLDEIAAFIGPYLQRDTNVRPLTIRARHWLARRMRRPTPGR